MESPKKISLVGNSAVLKQENTTEIGARRTEDSGGNLTFGETFSNRFTILETIGRSTTSTIYLARDNQQPEAESDDSARLVELKILADDSAEDRRRLELFYLESYAASKLSHQNIVGTRKANLIENTYYYAIEHKSDVESLQDIIERYAWLDLDVAIGIILQIARALEYAHRTGVLHLRLHPGNIVIDSKGIVSVTDFGIGLDDPAWTHQERSRHCDAQYLSPEQFKGGSSDHRSDLYSLGIVFYEMLTDRVPFDAENQDFIKHKHLTQEPLPPRLFSPDLPDRVSDLILKLLKKNPAHRLGSVKAILSELNSSPEFHLNAVDGEPEIKETGSSSEEDTVSPFVEELPVNHRLNAEHSDLEAPAVRPQMADTAMEENGAGDKKKPDNKRSLVSTERKAIALPNKISEPVFTEKAKRHNRWLYALAFITLILIIIGIVALGPDGRLPSLLRKLGFAAAGSLMQPGATSSQTPPPAPEKFKFDNRVNKRQDPSATEAKPPADEQINPREMPGRNKKILVRSPSELKRPANSQKVISTIKPRGKKPLRKPANLSRKNSASRKVIKAKKESSDDLKGSRKKKSWMKRLLDKLFQ